MVKTDLNVLTHHERFLHAQVLLLSQLLYRVFGLKNCSILYEAVDHELIPQIGEMAPFLVVLIID